MSFTSLPGSSRVNSLALLLLLALIALGAGLGLRDPSPPDEPRFVLAAKAMVETGQWLLPTRGSELYAHKPAVFMWLQAASWTLLRDWQLAFLLPSLLAALGTLALTYDLGRRLWHRRIGALAAWALLATLQFGLMAKRAQIDMVLVFFTTLSLWALGRHLLLDRQPRLALGAGLAAGLGTVTKGVGFLPLLALIPWRLLPRDRRGPGALLGGLILLGFVLGALIWLGPMLWAALGGGNPAHADYVREILLRQTGERYVNPWHHLRPAWYYLQVMGTLWLPGILLLPWLVPAWFRRLRRRDPRQWLLLGWVLLVLLFFSLSPAKREVYILPALPALALAAAPLLPGLLRRRGPRIVLLSFVLLLAAAFAALGLTGLLGIGGLSVRIGADRALSVEALNTLFAWMVGLAGVGIGLAIWGRLRRVGTVTISFMLLLWTVYGIGLAPALDASSSGRALMRQVGEHIGPEAELGLIAWREQQLLQADRPALEFGFSRPWHLQWQDAGVWLAADPQRRWVFVLDDALSPCVAREQTVWVGRANRRDWRLVPGSAWPVGCSTPAFEESAEDNDP